MYCYLYSKISLSKSALFKVVMLRSSRGEGMFFKFVDDKTKVGRITSMLEGSYLNAEGTEKIGCGVRKIMRHRYFFAIDCYHLQGGEQLPRKTKEQTYNLECILNFVWFCIVLLL